MPKNETKEESMMLSVRLPKSVHEALQRFADDDYRTVAGSIKMLVHKAMEEKGYLPKERSIKNEW